MTSNDSTICFCIVSRPPLITSDNISKLNSLRGQQTNCKAEIGSPPIAYTSDSAFAAATLPHRKDYQEWE